MRNALGQIDMGFENKEAAMALCSQLMAEAKEAAVDFVIFPEMTLTGFTLNPETYGEDRENSPSIDFFREEAKKNGDPTEIEVPDEKLAVYQTGLHVVMGYVDLCENGNYEAVLQGVFSTEQLAREYGDELVASGNIHHYEIECPLLDEFGWR